MKQKVFFDATPLINKHISGVGKVLLETLRALDTEAYAIKYDIYVFVPLNEVEKLPEGMFQFIKVKTLPFHHKFLSLFSRIKMSPPLDIFLGKGVYVFANFRNWNLMRSKSITYIHDIAFKIYPEFIQRDNLKYLNKYINVWLGRADRIVAVSESTKQELLKEFYLETVDVVSNAIDNSMVPKPQADINEALKKWSLPRNYYLHLSNVEPRKNLENLVNAFAMYSKQNKSDDALVIIGGDGWNNEGIVKAIESAEAHGVRVIRPQGYVPDEDIPAIMSGAIALLQVSWHEGFGLSLLGALACGTPAVISNIPALNEVSRGNEDRVVVTEPGNVEGIADAIAKVKDLPHITSPKNIARWDQSAEKLAEIIDSL